MSDYYYDTIRLLYHHVLYEDIQKYRLTHADIRTGIQNMKEVYKPNPSSLSSDFRDVADYNDPAHRSAYLHKYAPLHTALVRDMLSKSMRNVKHLFQDILSDTGRIEICSLGGGPGSDVLGVVSVLSAELGFFQLSATIIDIMEDWKFTFGAIIRELSCRNYGMISDFVQPQYFSWNYIGHNLLGKMSNDVNKAIQNAKLITMVKFVSAASCKDTAEMVKKIFRSLKPGAIVLFIDNDAGGFYRLVVKGAQESNMETVFGPLIHEHYINKIFDVKRFGYTPCLETKVTVHMWMKPNSNINSSKLQSRNTCNALNQYSLTNTSIYAPVTNDLNIPSHVSPQYSHNSSQSKGYQSSNIPSNKQSKDQRPPSSISKINYVSPTHTVPQRKANLNATPNVRDQLFSNSASRTTYTPTVPSTNSTINNLNPSRNTAQKKAIQTPRQPSARSQSLHHTYQTQPRHIVPNHSPSMNQNDRESEVDCCTCCVIS